MPVFRLCACLDVVRLIRCCVLNLSGRFSVGWRFRGDS
jgi:hypothetical protein